MPYVALGDRLKFDGMTARPPGIALRRAGSLSGQKRLAVLARPQRRRSKQTR